MTVSWISSYLSSFAHSFVHSVFCSIIHLIYFSYIWHSRCAERAFQKGYKVIGIQFYGESNKIPCIRPLVYRRIFGYGAVSKRSLLIGLSKILSLLTRRLICRQSMITMPKITESFCIKWGGGVWISYAPYFGTSLVSICNILSLFTVNQTTALDEAWTNKTL